MELDRRINSLLGVNMNIGQRVGEVNRERGNARGRSKSLVRKIIEAGGMVRNTRERECNTSAKSVRDISKGNYNMGKEL